MKSVYILVALDAARCRPRRATQAQPEPIQVTETRVANAVGLTAFQVISGAWSAADSSKTELIPGSPGSHRATEVADGTSTDTAAIALARKENGETHHTELVNAGSIDSAVATLPSDPGAIEVGLSMRASA